MLESGASCLGALRQPVQKFLERAPYPVAVQDDAGQITWVNPAFAEHFGVRRDAVLGRVAVAEIPESERAHYLDWVRSWREGRAGPGRLMVPMRDGGLRPHLVIPHPIGEPSERYLGTVLAILDEELFTVAFGDRVRAGGAVLRSVLVGLVDELDRARRRSESVNVSLEDLRRTEPALRGLSEREWAVASRIARGDRTSLVAADLGISANTVRNHLKAVFRKVGVTSQAELVLRFRRWRQAATASAQGGP